MSKTQNHAVDFIVLDYYFCFIIAPVAEQSRGPRAPPPPAADDHHGVLARDLVDVV